MTSNVSSYSNHYKSLVNIIIENDSIDDCHKLISNSCIERILNYDGQSFSPVELAVYRERVKVLKYIYSMPLEDTINRIMIEQLTKAIKDHGKGYLFSILMEEDTEENDKESFRSAQPTLSVATTVLDEGSSRGEPNLSVATTIGSNDRTSIIEPADIPPDEEEESIVTSISTKTSRKPSIEKPKPFPFVLIQPSLLTPPVVVEIRTQPSRHSIITQYKSYKSLNLTKNVAYFEKLFSHGYKAYKYDKSLIGELLKDVLDAIYLGINTSNINIESFTNTIAYYLRQYGRFKQFSPLILSLLESGKKEGVFIFYKKNYLLNLQLYKENLFPDDIKGQMMRSALEDLFYLEDRNVVLFTQKDKREIYEMTHIFIKENKEFKDLEPILNSLLYSKSSRCCVML